MSQPVIETPTEAPKPTTKPSGSSFSTVAIIAAIVSLFIGTYILAAAAVGFAIRAKMIDQPRAVLALGVAIAVLVFNVGFAFLLA